MRRKIPSTTALSAFEAAARHQSYTKAAEELSVTQSAVCRQIGTLEEFLGVPLFQRSRRGVALTAAGRNYAVQVRARLDEVERDALTLMSRRAEGGTLELATVPTFATRWLLPRLPDFSRRHPDIQLNLYTQTRPFLFEGTHFDAAIHAGTAAWAGTEGLMLMPELLIPVCSPRLVVPGGAGRGRSRRASRGADAAQRVDWSRHTLLQISTRPYLWREWFNERGLRVDGDMTGPSMELFSMLAEAATQGLGIALVPHFLVQREVARGELIHLVPDPAPSGRHYFLMIPERSRGNPALRHFSEWIRAQAGHDPLP